MNLNPQRRESPDVNITPLIDVVFLLLIFFMVSTTFKHASEIQIELPEASNEPVERNPKLIELVIDIDGNYFLNEKAVANKRLKTLKRALQEVSAKNYDLPLLIRADANTPHQAVVTAMDASSQLGFSKLSIATTKVKDQ